MEPCSLGRVARAAGKLESAVVEMTRVATVVEATSQPMPRRDPLRKYMDIIYQEVAPVSHAIIVCTSIPRINSIMCNFANVLWGMCHLRMTRQNEAQYIFQAESSVIKPAQAARDDRGRVNLDDLTDTDLDYGCDEKSLASLRRRLKKAINTYDGEPQYQNTMVCMSVRHVYLSQLHEI